ncbi:hypothetical protein C0Q70_04726 [Pomacea canaliculata]|uniref:MAM domain-containing protein n=1 Tax=Pomacea canaliculata TaxID=400727 RepID=A0A2T7PJA1_POMCA|nr:hypothetical protein C0Q70_04726 [Pomacea canaliculata]
MALFECKKKFSLVGQDFAACLSNGVWSQQVPVCVRRGCPNLGALPHLTVTKQHQGGVLYFDCPSDMRREGPPTLMCDGTNWNAAPPKCLYGESWECDFEEVGLCGWSQDVNDHFDWTWISGATPSPNTGPDGDHTTGTGHYIYMESSVPQKPGQVTRLISPPFRSTEDLCLRFFYHMMGFGGEMGNLDVYIRTEGEGGHQDEQVFHREGHQGAEWIRGDAVLAKRATPYKIVLAATLKSSFASDIAVDDIRVFNCTDPEFQSTPLNFLLPSLSTDPTTGGVPRDNPDKREIPLQTEKLSREATHLTQAQMAAYHELLDMYDPSGQGEWMPGSNNDIGSDENGDDNIMSNDTTTVMKTEDVVTTEMTTKDVISAITTDMTTKDVVTTDMTTKDVVTTDMTTKDVVTTDMTTKDVVTTDMTTKYDVTTDMKTEDVISAIATDMTTKDDVTIDMTTKGIVTTDMTTKDVVSVVTTDMTTKGIVTTDMTTKGVVTADMTTKHDVRAKSSQKTESSSKTDLQDNIFQFQFQFLYFFNLKGSNE